MKIDLQKLRNRKEYINEIPHPSLPLILWNYNHSCQIDGAWDEYTLMSRGLITDVDGNIIARPFKKFFNVQEKLEEFADNLLGQVPFGSASDWPRNHTIYEKLDGSLGIFYYNDHNEPCIATRGSFESDQARWATKWIRNMPGRTSLHPGNTYLFEIIYPNNRIVVNYGDRSELVLIAVIENETGKELDHNKIAFELGCRAASPFIGDFETARKYLSEHKGTECEGFVIKFHNGTRFKIKSDDYVRLHKMITGFSSKHIWECLSNGTKLDDILEKVPDEFYDWAKQTEAELRDKFGKIVYLAQNAFKETQKFDLRRDKAIWLTSNTPKLAPFVFAILDNKDPAPLIWKYLKPKYELPFKKTTEES